MIKIGLNGFGRIGRAITRIASDRKDLKIVAINDIDEDINNLSYLLKYDSTYGKFKKKLKTSRNKFFINKNIINFYSFPDILDVPWKKNKVDVLIEATGLAKNIKNSSKLVKKGIKKILITNSPNENIDFHMILGANELKYNQSKHNIISTSICDASALAPVLNSIIKNIILRMAL